MRNFPWIFRNARGAVLAGMLLIVLNCISSPATANSTFAGNIRLVEGVTDQDQVSIIRPGFTKMLSGKPGDALFEGDTIKTGAGVKTQLELADQTIITVAPNSNIQMKGYLIDHTASRRNAVMRVLKGTARFLVAKVFKTPNGGGRSWSHSSVTIETMNAVAGVRGTDLIVVHEGNETEIAVLEGVVAVKSAAAGRPGEVFLGANQLSRTKTGGAAGAAVELTPERREILLKRVTMVNPLSKTDALKKRKLKYDAGDIERDLAAGVPLSTIIDNAVQAGMTIAEVVDAAIDAGANPAAIVYTAIQEGYPSNDVVQAAIESGTLAQDVFSAALSAGATQPAVVAGAQNAGLAPGDIAGALANTSVVDPTSLSATATGPAGPASVIPPVLLPIGGGLAGAGGGTPSASPYKP